MAAGHVSENAPLDEVEHDSDNYQGQSLCYLPKPKADSSISLD